MSPCLFNLYVVYIMQNSGLDETQAEIKIARRNVNNLKYADDTTLMAESKEELKSVLMKVKQESEKAGLNSTFRKLRSWHLVPFSSVQFSSVAQLCLTLCDPIASRQIDGETMETVTDFILGGSKITEDGDCSHEMKRHLLIGRKAMTNLDSILKSRDITCLTKVCIVKAMVFPVIMYGCESWIIKKADC